MIPYPIVVPVPRASVGPLTDPGPSVVPGAGTARSRRRPARLSQSWSPARQPVYSSIPVAEPWSDAVRARYSEWCADGVQVTRACTDLGFLRTLPGLRSVAVRAQVYDDTAVCDVPSLERLTLLDGCGLALDAERLPLLRFLDVEDRPGLETLDACERLESLSVQGLRRAHTSWIGPRGPLRALYLRGEGQTLDLGGLAACPGIQWLDLHDIRIDDLSPLIDCADLSWLGLGNVTVPSLKPLESLPRLGHLTMDGVRIIRHGT